MQKQQTEVLLELLKEHGFKEVMVNVSHLAEEIERQIAYGEATAAQRDVVLRGYDDDHENALVKHMMDSGQVKDFVHDVQSTEQHPSTFKL